MKLREVTSSLVVLSSSVNDILTVTLSQLAVVLRYKLAQTKGKCVHVILGRTVSLSPLLDMKKNPFGHNFFAKYLNSIKATSLRGSQY